MSPMPSNTTARERSPEPRAVPPSPPVRAPGAARVASLLYGLTVPSIVVWALAHTPRSAMRASGVAERLAFFGPLVAYVLGLALSVRRVRARPADEGTVPAVLAYGLVSCHALLGLLGSTLFAIDALTAYPLGAVSPLDAFAKGAGTIAFLCWPAVLLGWVAVLFLRARVRMSGAMLAIAVSGALWMLLLGTQAGSNLSL